MTRGFRRPSPSSRARCVAAPPRIPPLIRIFAAPCSPRLRDSQKRPVYSTAALRHSSWTTPRSGSGASSVGIRFRTPRRCAPGSRTLHSAQNAYSQSVPDPCSCLHAVPLVQGTGRADVSHVKNSFPFTHLVWLKPTSAHPMSVQGTVFSFFLHAAGIVS